MIPMTNEAARIRLINCFAEAFQQSMLQVRGGEWVCVPSSAVAGVTENRSTSNVLMASLWLRGTLHGRLTLKLQQDHAKALFADDDAEDSWQAVMRGLLQYLPKRAADAGMFAFSVASQETTDSYTGHVRIGGLDVSASPMVRGTVDALADQELLGSLQVAEWNASREASRARNDLVRGGQLGRVMDVPLAVTLRFGQRQMRLRDVLELDTGVLVELDRQVEEPVDLMLGDRVIARGSVVIVDGNYGLRVTEIVERHAVAGEKHIAVFERINDSEADHSMSTASFVA